MSNLKKKKINWTRILCLFLAVLMVGGVAVLGITVLVQGAFATEITYEASDYSFSSETDGDTYIAVGLMYSSNITVGFEIKAPYGFVIGSTLITDTVRSFDPFYVVNSNIASATVDANLSKRAMTYSLTDDESKVVIGGYHIELTPVVSEESTDESVSNEPTLEFLVSDVASFIPADSGLYPIPTCIGGEFKIRLGSYSSEAAVNEAIAAYAECFPGYSIGVASPSQTAVSVVNPETDKILFEYDSATGQDTVGFMAYQGDSYESYIQTPAKNLYEGVMTFIPKHTDTYTGVALTNLLDLESYIEGVLPYEISNSWSKEALRTFAITIRSYAIANYCSRYKKYGFDLFSNTTDQVYRGRNRVNDAIVDAVKSTEGLVITHDGKIVSAFYSSSMGGSTVGSQYVWGSARGFLKSVSTPWEKYSEYNNGLWYKEVSPKELLNTLRTSSGITSLSGEIVSIEVETVEDNPEYVYAMTFTDSSGNTARINRSDAVRIALSKYVKSSNFVVGKGAVIRSYNNVLDTRIEGGITHEPLPPENDGDFNVRGYLTEKRLLISDATVITGDGRIEQSQYSAAHVLTSTGYKMITSSIVAIGEEKEGSVPFDYNKVSILRYEPEVGIETYNSDSTASTPEIVTDTDTTEAYTNDTELPESSPETETDTVPDTETTDPAEDSSDVTLETDQYFSETGTPEDKEPVAEPGVIHEIVSDFGHVKVITTVETVTETLTASNSGNFIFAGKGYGHGVGISQYGVKDLSDAGAYAEDIISIYFTNVQIKHISELG